MFRKLNTKYITNGDVLSFKKTYDTYENGNFQASSQHETMAALYIGEMTEVLKDFHKNALIGDYNYLTNNGSNPLPDSFYEALAWQGLKNHNVKAYIDLKDDKKNQLENSLTDYYHDITSNCPNN